jgi:hypothetical protein
MNKTMILARQRRMEKGTGRNKKIKRWRFQKTFPCMGERIKP